MRPDTMLALQRAYGNRGVTTLLRDAQMKGVPSRSEGDEMVVAPEIERGIEGARGQGQPLDAQVRESMEAAFGADLGAVRVHTDGRADALSQSLKARAFTSGQDLFFKGGEYEPKSHRGRTLIAHELAHTRQQMGRGRVARWGLGGTLHEDVTKAAFQALESDSPAAYLKYPAKAQEAIAHHSDSMDLRKASMANVAMGWTQLNSQIGANAKNYDELAGYDRNREEAINHAEAGLYGKGGQFSGSAAQAQTRQRIGEWYDKAVHAAPDWGTAYLLLGLALHTAEDIGAHGHGAPGKGHDPRRYVPPPAGYQGAYRGIYTPGWKGAWCDQKAHNTEGFQEAVAWAVTLLKRYPGEVQKQGKMSGGGSQDKTLALGTPVGDKFAPSEAFAGWQSWGARPSAIKDLEGLGTGLDPKTLRELVRSQASPELRAEIERRWPLDKPKVGPEQTSTGSQLKALAQDQGWMPVLGFLGKMILAQTVAKPVKWMGYKLGQMEQRPSLVARANKALDQAVDRIAERLQQLAQRPSLIERANKVLDQAVGRVAERVKRLEQKPSLVARANKALDRAVDRVAGKLKQLERGPSLVAQASKKLEQIVDWVGEKLAQSERKPSLVARANKRLGRAVGWIGKALKRPKRGPSLASRANKRLDRVVDVMGGKLKQLEQGASLVSRASKQLQRTVDRIALKLALLEQRPSLLASASKRTGRERRMGRGAKERQQARERVLPVSPSKQVGQEKGTEEPKTKGEQRASKEGLGLSSEQRRALQELDETLRRLDGQVQPALESEEEPEAGGEEGKEEREAVLQ